MVNMKIKEIIAKLKEYDSEYDVFYNDDEGQQRSIKTVNKIKCIKTSFYGLIPIKNKDLLNSVFVTEEERKKHPVDIIFLNYE